MLQKEGDLQKDTLSTFEKTLENDLLLKSNQLEAAHKEVQSLNSMISVLYEELEREKLS